MRYIQDPKTNKLVPADEYYAQKQVSSAAVVNDIEPFVSPIDGSVIGSRTDLRNHNARHGVIQQLEYGDTHSREAEKRRHDHYLGRRSTEESFRRKQQIHEIINRMERER